MVHDERRVLRTPESARYIGWSISTLEKSRRTGTGPPFIRIGVRAVGYRVTDLDRWIATRQRGRRNGD